MKRLIISLTAGILLSATAMAAQAADTQFGIVNVRNIMTVAPQVKAIDEKLKKEFKPKQDAILRKAQALQADIKNLQKNKAVLSKAKLSALQDKIARNEAMFRNDQSQYQMAVTKEQTKLMQGFIKDLKSAVAKVAAKDHLVVVFPANTLIYSNPSLDVTKQVLKELG